MKHKKQNSDGIPEDTFKKYKLFVLLNFIKPNFIKTTIQKEVIGMR